MLIFVHQKMPAAAVPAAAAIAAALGCRSIPASLHPLRFKMRPTYRYLQIMASASQMQVNTVPVAAASEDGLVVTNLLDKLRSRISKDATKPKTKKELSVIKKDGNEVAAVTTMATNFRELGLSDELMAAVEELKISVPTEVQSLAIPAVLDGENVVVASHTGSGKTLAYMLPIVQALRNDEAAEGKMVKAKRPRAVVLCPTRELAEQVLHVAKSICHHARFRSALISGGFRPRLQEDVLSVPIDMVVGTPGRLLVHVEEGNLAYGEIKYVVLDEADTMFDQGFGPEVRKFLAPLRNRASQPGGKSFQTVLVTATITKAVQKLLDEEFPGIKHIHTSTLHKKIASARHHFIRLKGNENKLEVLSQVLEPLIAKKDSVMVFCNTVGSCRAVDHYLQENNIPTVNYHGEVPAEDRNQNLNKFRNAAEGNTIPALVCTDLAARGLDLVVDHVIMFDFPRNSIDYLHRTGRTARMGAKGKITSLVGKRDLILAEQIEDTISKGGTLEAVISNREELKAAKEKELKEKQKTKAKLIKGGTTQANEKVTFKAVNKGNKWSKMTKSAVKEGSKPFASSKFTKIRTKTRTVQKVRIIKDKEQPRAGGRGTRMGEVVKKARTLQKR